MPTCMERTVTPQRRPRKIFYCYSLNKKKKKQLKLKLENPNLNQSAAPKLRCMSLTITMEKKQAFSCIKSHLSLGP